MIDATIFTKFPLFYVSPDIKRALGIESILPNFHIICSYEDAIVHMAKERGVNIFCLAKPLKNTSLLLSDPLVLQYIKDKSKGQRPNIIYFKPNLKADQICQKFNYKKLVNSYELNEEFENKIKFFDLAKKIAPQYTPKATIAKLNTLTYQTLHQDFGNIFAIQFGHGWAGRTTFFIKNESDFSRLKNKYPATTVKVTKYIEGFTVLNNCCIYTDKIFIGRPGVQLNGIKELSGNEMVTCGRQWPSLLLNKEQVSSINHLTNSIGRAMMKRGYIGYFGLDFIVSKENGRLFISENNARFTASTPFFTKLEEEISQIPLLIYHIAGFLGIKNLPSYKSSQIKGSQIILRNDQGYDFIIKKDFATGIYELKNGEPKLLKRDYDIRNTKENEFIFIQPKKGTKITKDEEIARIETKESVLASVRSLSPKFNQIVNILKSG